MKRKRRSDPFPFRAVSGCFCSSLTANADKNSRERGKGQNGAGGGWQGASGGAVRAKDALSFGATPAHHPERPPGPRPSGVHPRDGESEKTSCSRDVLLVNAEVKCIAQKRELEGLTNLIDPICKVGLHKMRMRSHMYGSINDFELDCISAGFTARKNIVEDGNNFVSRYVPELVSHLVNPSTWNVVAWPKYFAQSVHSSTQSQLKNVGVSLIVLVTCARLQQFHHIFHGGSHDEPGFSNATSFGKSEITHRLSSVLMDLLL